MVSPIGKISRTYRHMGRYRQILAGLAGAPFMLAGRAVVKTKLLLGRAEIN